MFSATNILNQTEHKRISSRFFGLFNRKGCILTIVSFLTTKKKKDVIARRVLRLTATAHPLLFNGEGERNN